MAMGSFTNSVVLRSHVLVAAARPQEPLERFEGGSRSLLWCLRIFKTCKPIEIVKQKSNLSTE